jgi:dTDP-4-amino-4,6-dideoxygalactose transaminase
MAGSESIAVQQHVPFLDLGPMHAALKGPLLDEISLLIDEGAFTNGTHVADFEAAFAAFCGADHCVGVASGLDALRLALLASGVGAGDDVLVPANTFVATLEAITQTGARPVIVDASERDYNIDVEAAAAAMSGRTRVVLPVHLYGQLADMRLVMELGLAHDLIVIEDACQAHGAERDGLRAGTTGDAGAFSFYPGKNLGAFGDAGALVTESSGLAEGARALREHGQRVKYLHEREGYTARLDTIQALVLLRKLPRLPAWNAERAAAATYYDAHLDGVGDLRLPPVPAGSIPVWHLYVIRTAARERLTAFLAERGIATGRHYPVPVHLAPAYAGLGYVEGAFPVAERLARELLSLPIFPGISEEQLEVVVGAVRDFFAGGS